MADYVSDVHNVYFSTTFLPVKELRMVATAIYNKSTGSLDPVHMPDVSEQTGGALENMDYDFSMINKYSNLDFALWRFSMGFEYRVSPLWMFTLDADYARLDDSAAYVYGIQTGSYYVIRTGARMTF